MLRPIDKIMLHDVDLTPAQWEKVRQFFAHNMGNALQSVSCLLECDPIDAELVRNEVLAACARFQAMNRLMERYGNWDPDAEIHVGGAAAHEQQSKSTGEIDTEDAGQTTDTDGKEKPHARKEGKAGRSANAAPHPPQKRSRHAES